MIKILDVCQKLTDYMGVEILINSLVLVRYREHASFVK